MKYLKLLLLSSILTCFAQAEEKAILNIESGDTQRIEIELNSDRSIQVRIYFTELEKLTEFQSIQKENYRKQVTIQVNGVTVSEPVFLFKEPYQSRNISLAFKEMEPALEQVYSLMPDLKPN
jgi:hypothetical protein